MVQTWLIHITLERAPFYIQFFSNFLERSTMTLFLDGDGGGQIWILEGNRKS